MSQSETHLQRVEEALADTYALQNLDVWIERKTKLDGRPFSFKGHEFQRTIIQDAVNTSIVVKCAQVGLSEILARWTLAACTTQSDFTVIYTFPTTNDAEKFCKTRIDPCINDSAELSRAINPNLNNSEIKQFNRNSFIYFRGTLSETAALSVPANAVIHDEVDKSNLTQMSVYVSRLQHKPHKIRKLFSTPTVNKYGISKEAETARRYRQMLQCNHCNFQFLPDYFNNVIIPGWDRDKKEITKSNLKDIRWQEARLLCPHCGKMPEVRPEHQEWVCENPMDAYPANAWFITPFSAPTIIGIPYLVKNSTEYDKFSEFMNQALGLTSEDSDDSITEEDLAKALVRADLKSSETHYLGADMGLLCRISIGRITADGIILVVHREIVPYHQFEERLGVLRGLYRVAVCLFDAQPYVDMVRRLTERDPNAYAGVFTTGTPSVLYSVKEQEEDAKEGKMNMRRINITRTMAFDSLMAEIKAEKVVVQAQDALDDAWKNEMRSLKRIAKFDRTNELVYSWEKTDGQDHSHFSLLYLYLAIKMRGLASGTFNRAQVPLIRSFPVKQR